MSLYSTINTSIRSAVPSIGLTQSHIGKISPAAKGIIFVSGVVLPVVGWGVALAIYEIIQQFVNEPKKQREQLRIACAFTTIELAGKKSITFPLDDLASITYEERDGQVFVRHSIIIDEAGSTKSIESPLFKDKQKTSYTSLDEFQQYRRRDIIKKYPVYQNRMPLEFQDELTLAVQTTLKAKLSTLSQFDVSNNLLRLSKKFFSLEEADIQAAYTHLSKAKLESNGSTLLDIALLHNTLNKIGTTAFGNNEFAHFKHVYNLGKNDPAALPLSALQDNDVKLSDNDKQIMIRIEIAKLHPDNISDDKNLSAGSPDKKKVNASISVLLHRLYRPNDFYNPTRDDATVHKPEFHENNLHGPVIPEIKAVTFGDTNPATVFGYFIYSGTKNPTIDLLPPLVSFALNYDYQYEASPFMFTAEQHAQINREANLEKIRGNNYFLSAWIEASKAYNVPATNQAINTYLLAVFDEYKTLNVSVEGASRNSLTNP